MRLTAFLFLILAIAAHAQTLTFTPNELVAASDSISNSQRPRLVYSNGGTLHLIWSAGSTLQGGVYHAAAPNGGEFGARQLISGNVHGVFIDLSSGPTLRAKGNHLVAGWEDRNEANRGTWTVRSTDSGLTWETPVRADSRLQRMRYYQSVGIFPDGRVSQMWMTHDASGHHPTYEWAVQTGDTIFSSPVDAAAIATMDVCDCCPPDQLVLDDGQTVLTAFRNNISNLREIHVTRSTDGGVTFLEDHRVDTSGWILAACPTTGPHLTYDGQTVLATWMSAINNVSRIWVARSLNGGATWEPMREVATASAGPLRNYPQVALRGDFAVVIWEGASEQFTSQIFAAASTDAGVTWGEPATVTDAPDQNFIHGSVAIAPDNTVDVVWKDLRTGAPRIFRARGVLSTQAADDDLVAQPTSLSLSTYPNPFNAAVHLKYDLASAAAVEVNVFDMTGREVANLFSGMQDAGSHHISWNANNLPSGIYLARLTAGETIRTQKLMLLK